MKPLPLAAQLYTVRDECARDFEGTLRAVAKMGYRAVEFAGLYGMQPHDLRKLIAEIGLQAVSAHFRIDRLETQLDAVIQESHVLGIPLVACPVLAEHLRADANGWRTIAGTLDAIGAKLRQRGLQLCYHNHDFEFARFEGKSGLEWLYDSSSSNVHAELDVFWVKQGGDDPVHWIQRLPGRCSALHLKDMAPDGSFIELGKGTIDFPGVLRAAEKSGTIAYIVEQDTCARPPLDSLAISLEYMRKIAPSLA